MAFVEIPARRRSPQIGIAAVVIIAFVVLVFGRTICSYVIDYFWWREMGQVPTWLRMTAYRYLPGLAAWLIVFPALWITHARGMNHAGERLSDWPLYARISTLGERAEDVFYITDRAQEPLAESAAERLRLRLTETLSPATR